MKHLYVEDDIMAKNDLKQQKDEASENYDKRLEAWFHKWLRKPVTGRCLIELKQMKKELLQYDE
jgi:hypothetical protein